MTVRSAARVLSVTGLALAVGACRHPDPTNLAVEALRPPAAPDDTAAPRDPAAPLRVATYNIHHIDGAHLTAALAADPDLAAADVVLLQEVVRHDGADSSACATARARGWSCAFAPGHGLGAGSLGVAIISRRALADTEIIELPYFDVHFNAGRRVALAATIDVDGTALRLYSVHLDNRLNPGQRQAQLAPVLTAAGAWDGPVLIAGDMNTSPFAWGAHVVPLPVGTQGKKLEAFVRAHGFATPVVASGPTSQWLSMRLDAVYTRGLRVLEVEVEGGVRASDHLPMWVDVELAPAASSVATAPARPRR